MTWYVEEGIGEHRAVRLDGGRIVQARIDWPGGLASGHVADATLVSRAAGAARGTVRFASGEEALVDRLPRDASEGATLRVEVVRGAIGESGRTKLAQARPSDKTPACPTLAERLRDEGHDVRIVHRFPEGDWDELAGEAIDGSIAFAGGSLLFAPTPAMTVVDIDGALRPRELALAAITPLAEAILRFDLGGSIGIDFPTLADKADRRAADVALGAALAGWPHERTAMNGFGLVQLVAKLERPSLLHLARLSRTGFAARSLLRRAERVAEPGVLLLTCHPAVEAALVPAWREDLSRRTGREIRIAADPALALDAGLAQAVAR